MAGMVLLDPVDATPFEAESVLPALRYATTVNREAESVLNPKQTRPLEAESVLPALRFAAPLVGP